MISYKDFIKKTKKTWDEKVQPTLEEVSRDVEKKVNKFSEEVQYQYEYEIKPSLKIAKDNALQKTEDISAEAHKRWIHDVQPSMRVVIDKVNEFADQSFEYVGKKVLEAQNKASNSLALRPPFDDCVRKAILASAAAGPLGVVPGPVDILAVCGIWTPMIIAISQKSARKIDNPADFCKSLATGLVSYIVGCKVAQQIFNLLPGGIFVGVTLSTVTNVYFTYRVAEVIINLLNDDKLAENTSVNYCKLALRILKKRPTLAEAYALKFIFTNWIKDK